MSQDLTTQQSWKPGESQLNTFETTYFARGSTMVFNTNQPFAQIGNSGPTVSIVKATDLIILKMIGVW